MMKKIISLFVIISLTLSSFAQSVETVEWGSFKEMPEETSFQDAIGFDSDSYYYILTGHKVNLNPKKVWMVGVTSLTNTIESTTEILLPSVSGVQTQFAKMFYKEGKFILFSFANNSVRNKKILYVSYLKPDGTLKNKPKELVSIPLSNAPKDGFDIFLSDDEKQIVIESHKTFKKYNSDKLNTIVLDFSLAEVFKSDIILDKKFNNKEVVIVQKSFNQGKFIFLVKSEIVSTRSRSTTKNYDFVVLVYNTAKKSIFDFLVTMPKFKVADARYTINQKGNVVVAGFVRGRSVKFANEKQGFFFKKYNPNTLTAIPDLDLKSFYMKFPREFLLEIQKPEYGENKNFQYAYGVHSVEELANGGYVILSEQKWVDQRAVGKKGDDKIDYYHYQNIMAAGVSKKGRLNWIKIYPKNQLTTNDKGYYSSFKVLKIKNKLKLFYNGNEKNLHTGTLKSIKEFNNNVRTSPKGLGGIYSIYWDGSYERDPMFSGGEKGIVFIPQTLAPNSIEYGVGVVKGKQVKFGSFTIE